MKLVLRPELLGFLPSRTGRVPDSVSAKAFKSACYAVARATDGAVGEFRAPDVTPSFFLAEMSNGAERTAVLCHRIEPYLAFATPIDVADMEVEFVNRPALSAAFCELSAFTPLAVETLLRPLIDEDIAGLSHACVRTLRYWRVKTLGEAMFNWFD